MIMETKLIIKPFDVKVAKKIMEGIQEGKIITRDGRKVRILCFDRQDIDFPIVALVGDNEFDTLFYKNNGCAVVNNEKSDDDLVIAIYDYEFNPFDKVLVKNFDNDYWTIDLFYRMDLLSEYKYVCMTNKWHFCKPYIGNEHLVGSRKKN